MADPTPQQLAKALTLNERMGEFGFDPSLKRGTLLPFGTNQQGENEWAVPEIGYGMMKAFVLPGHVAQGGTVTNNDVTDSALNIAGMGGFGSMGLGAKAVGGQGGKVLGANVYQGGPHKYGPEGAAQSLQHMSKGEGAQAYGWGRYDAGNPAVGKQYKEFVTSKGNDLSDPGNLAASMVYRTPDGTVESGLTELRAVLKSIDNYPNSYKHDPKAKQTTQAAIDYLESGKALPDQGGYLYKHDLPDDAIARYMDWDKPLSQQPESVQKALMNLPNAHKLPPEWTGAQLYESSQLVPGGYTDKKAASEALGKAGIPGLRYLDGGSRGAGEGSHNYVTWDQEVLNRMKLLERNGETFPQPLPTDTASRMARAEDAQYNYARRSQNADSPDNGTGYAMFAEKRPLQESVIDRLDDLSSYGKHGWLASAKGAVPVEDIQKDIVRALRNRGLHEEYQTTAANLSRSANPENIVDSAGLWDEPRLVSAIYEDVLEPKGITAIKTADGLLSFNHPYVRSEKALFDPAKADSADLLAMTGNPAMLAAGQNQDAGPSKMALELAKRLSDQEFYAKGGI